MGKHLTQIGENPEVGNTEGKTFLYFYFNIFYGGLLEDLTGREFGYWTVLERDTTKYKTRDVRWNCVCKCGTKKSVLGKYLLNGKSISCGCSSKKDYSGERFGKLLVINTTWDYNGSNNATCLCKCDCGNYKYIKASYLKNTKSCGCSRLAKSVVDNRYGSLVVKEMLYHFENTNKTYCRCLCDCGNEIIVKLESLKTKNTTSCGCKHSPNLIGNKYGLLTVIREVESNTSQRKWECLCECGNRTILTSYLLKSGHTKSCGCLRSIKTSIGETVIADYLHSMNISFQPQKTFDGLVGVGNKLLRFDFYIPMYNTIIEYDGIQHNEPVEYWGGEEGLNIRKEHDYRKAKYCSDNNINLIRIGYLENKEEILTKIKEIIKNIEKNPVTTTVLSVTA